MTTRKLPKPIIQTPAVLFHVAQCARIPCDPRDAASWDETLRALGARAGRDLRGTIQCAAQYQIAETELATARARARDYASPRAQAERAIQALFG